MRTKSDFAELLTAWRDGHQEALDELTPLVYEELRRLAHRYMRTERGNHTLPATAVVHEAFMRLIQSEMPLKDRTHFFAVASRLMRRVLVDHARGRARGKRYGLLRQVPLDEEISQSPESEFDIVDLDLALERLAQMEPRLARTIELHYFGGLTYEQIATTVEASAATVHRDIRLARAWLLSYLANSRT